MTRKRETLICRNGQSELPIHFLDVVVVRLLRPTFAFDSTFDQTLELFLCGDSLPNLFQFTVLALPFQPRPLLHHGVFPDLALQTVEPHQVPVVDPKVGEQIINLLNVHGNE